MNSGKLKYFPQVGNAGVRAASMGGKIVFIGALSVNQQLTDIANYNYIQTVTTFLIVVSGVELYNVTNRMLIQKNDGNFAAELAILGVGTLISIFAIFAFFERGIIALPLLIALLVSEHLSQEIFRKLVFVNRQIIASLVVFLKSGIWAYGLSYLFIFQDMAVTLNTIILVWAVFSMLSVVFGLVFLLKDDRIRSYIANAEPFKCLSSSKLLVSAVATYFVVNVFSRLPLAIDKIIAREWFDLDVVGIYAVLTTVIFGSFSIFEALIISYKTPQFLHAKDNRPGMAQLLKSYVISSGVFWIVVGAALYLVIFKLYLLGVDYSGFETTYFFLLLGIVSLSTGLGPHLYLYASAKDFTVASLNLVFPVVFLICLGLLVLADIPGKLEILPLCFCVSYLIQGLLRSIFAWKLYKAPDVSP